ncbi:MAG: hypothetical protein ACI89X_001986 [Planctomycetota bacterium]
MNTLLITRYVALVATLSATPLFAQSISIKAAASGDLVTTVDTSSTASQRAAAVDGTDLKQRATA